MTTYFDQRGAWLRDLRAVADDRPEALDARCAEVLRVDPMWPDVDFFFRGLAHAWVSSPNEYVALAIVHAIEREVRADMRAVNAAHNATRPTVNMGDMVALMFTAWDDAWREWSAKHPESDDQPEDLAPAADRVAAMCSDAHDLMHALARAQKCGDNPRAAAANLLAFLKDAP